MDNRREISIKIFSIVVAPVILYVIGIIISEFYPHAGSEWGVAVTWLAFGIFSVIVSLITGPIVKYLYRNKTVGLSKELLGYTMPPFLALIMSIMVTISIFMSA